MITRLKVKNYRSIEEIDLTLSPLTVLVGKNGAGKSTILDVLRFVRDALSVNISYAVKEGGEIRSFFRWTPDNIPLDIEILVEFDSGTIAGQYSFVFGKLNGNGLGIKAERCVINTPELILFDVSEQNNSLVVSVNETTDNWSIDELPRNSPIIQLMAQLSKHKQVYASVISYLTDTEFYNIAPKDIRKPQDITESGRLSGDGSNIGEVLRQIAGDENGKIHFCQILGYMVDGVQDLRVTDAEGYYITALKHCHRDGEPWFSLAHESEGTLKALAFLAAIYQEHTHSLIAIEEPDTHLYLRAIAGISDVLREGLLRRQIIITTQSPDLLTRFGVDEMRIVEKIDGITYAGIIDNRQRGIIEDEIFGAGDLLRVEGMYRKPVVDDEVAAVA